MLCGLCLSTGLSACKFCHSVSGWKGCQCQVLGSAGQISKPIGDPNICIS